MSAAISTSGLPTARPSARCGRPIARPPIAWPPIAWPMFARGECMSRVAEARAKAAGSSGGAAWRLWSDTAVALEPGEVEQPPAQQPISARPELATADRADAPVVSWPVIEANVKLVASPAVAPLARQE